MPSEGDRVGLLTVSKGRMRALARGPVKGLSIAQLVMGGLAIIAEIVVLSVYRLNVFSATSQGIWCGAAFIVCGVIGIAASKQATRAWVITHLIMCMLVCLFSAAIIILSALTAAYNYGNLYDYNPDYIHQDYIDMQEPPYPYYPSNTYWDPHRPAVSYHHTINVLWVVQFAMNLLMAVLGLASGTVAVIGATLSCIPLCCDPVQKYLKEQQENLSADNDVILFDQADALPKKTLPDMEGATHTKGHVSVA